MSKKGANKMTNEQLIFEAKMAQGIEADVHTYAEWKRLGFQVKKGEKATLKIAIWNRAEKKNEDDKEDTSYFYTKIASFFTDQQVEKLA
jgi:antirestriction protein ArdC